MVGFESEVKIVKAYPPNYDSIIAVLKPNKEATFCYGETIYNPSGKDIPPDIQHHEYIHSKQQGDNPDLWWYNYLSDPEFRLHQEIETYGEQYLFAKEHIKKASAEAWKEHKVLAAGETKLIKWALESMAFALSSESYGKLISYGEAESKIRNYRQRGPTS